MSGATTISGEQRDALNQLVCDHLGGLDDVRVGMEENRDFVAARRLGLEFARDFRLLEDLGWGKEDDRDAVELTMPAAELTGILSRLHDEAERASSDLCRGASLGRKTRRPTGASTCYGHMRGAAGRAR